MEEGNLDIRDRAMKIARGELYYILLEYILKERIITAYTGFFRENIEGTTSDNRARKGHKKP